jgi:hypothetical protein
LNKIIGLNLSILERYTSKISQGPLKRLAQEVTSSIEDKLENTINDVFSKALSKVGVSSSIVTDISSRFGDNLKHDLSDRYFRTSSTAQTRVSKEDICSAVLPKSIETDTDSADFIARKVSVKGVSDVYQYPRNIGKYFIKLKFSEYTRTTPQSVSTLDFKNAIVLPVPNNIEEKFNLNINEQATGVIGAGADIIQNSAAGGGSLSESLTKNGAALGYSMLADKGAASLVSGAGSVIGAGVGAIPFGGGVGNAIDKTGSGLGSLIEAAAPVAGSYLGSIPNPHMAVFFNGTSMRKHQFEWTFNPRNEKESLDLQKIISKLKANSLPAFSPLGTAVLQYPFLCQIELEPWYSKEQDFIKYKPALLQEVSVNYSPNGIPSFFEGTNLPTFIRLSLSFIETEYFTANDFGRLGRTAEEGDKLSSIAAPIQTSIADFINGVSG